MSKALGATRVTPVPKDRKVTRVILELKDQKVTRAILEPKDRKATREQPADLSIQEVQDQIMPKAKMEMSLLMF